MLRGRRYASFEVSRSGFFDLDNGAEHLWFRSLLDSLLRANFISKSPSCSNWGSDGIFGWDRATGPLQWHYIEPGKLVQNAFVESFKSKLRDKCLNERA
jgi:integrase-like protein